MERHWPCRIEEEAEVVAGAVPTEEVMMVAVAVCRLVLLHSAGWRPCQRLRREGQEGKSKRDEAGKTGP
ncbi:hypothetical protein OsI_33518 [Oryza sativa Indica Group]|jgi:hypothetical protein|uniref:Uncharacterized protein n=1 Tax=Oryza sativa subsp. indica TaxID=39946 RepID=B8BGR7_ORYSI|nr:hypothetical protein OsI_33518 [Oryza sativa Indica Group]